MTKLRKMLVTAALPYANGPLHLGHLLEHIQLDIWVRTHKMLGHTCISVCGDDAHGTPIMLKAERLGISPEALITSMQQSHEQDFAAFAVHYDCYHNTHSEENRLLVAQIYESLRVAGDIVIKKIRQAYDPVREMFLPDRYIKGTCPKCGAEEQYGDNCEVCGATYSATELVNPTSVVSGSKPIEKESEHYFFNLPHYEQFLKEWAKKGHLQVEMTNKLEEWFEAGLKQWDITRDSPYFGFLIPGTEDKYFYVWLDAPIGYMAIFKKFCKENQLSFAEFWDKDSSTELYHFVGKDIIYFHALFWPAVLAGSGHRLPNAIFAHGFLTVNGQKMSKSRGTYIEARQYLEHLHPEYLRYYYAAKSNGSIEDLDLNLADFISRVNADLIGKVVNIASRCAGFINKHFNNQLASKHRDAELFAAILAKREEVIAAFVQRDSAQAIRIIMASADKINQFIDAQKPWQAIKEDARFTEVQEVCTQGLNLFRLLLGYLKPILPLMSEAGEQFLNCPPLTWASLDKPLFNQSINHFSPLLQRIEKERVEALTTRGTASLSKN